MGLGEEECDVICFLLHVLLQLMFNVDETSLGDPCSTPCADAKGQPTAVLVRVLQECDWPQLAVNTKPELPQDSKSTAHQACGGLGRSRCGSAAHLGYF